MIAEYHMTKLAELLIDTLKDLYMIDLICLDVKVYDHFHPSYRNEYLPHELVVMSYLRELPKDAYEMFLDKLQNEIMIYSESKNRINKNLKFQSNKPISRNKKGDI